MAKGKKHVSDKKAGKKSKNKKQPGSGTDLPQVVRQSGKKVRRIFAQARDAALKKRGDAQRADEAAFEVLARSHEQVGDRFERKDKARRQTEADVEKTAAPESAAPEGTATEGAGSPEASSGKVTGEEPQVEKPAPPETLSAPPAETGTAPAPAETGTGRAPAEDEDRPGSQEKPATRRAPAGKGAGSRQSEVQTWTVAQLREAARHLEIQGRSRMSREELVKAVQEAQRAGSGSAARR